MTTEEKKVYAYNYYIGKGVSPVHAAAIVGNLAKESNFDTTVLGTADDKGSRGIGQWHSERLGNLKRFAGNNWQNLDKQLDFVLHELNTTEKGAYKELLKTTTVEDATRVFMNKYERPSANPKINRINDRIKEALSVSGITPTSTQEQTKTSQYEEFNPYLATNTGAQETAGEYKEPQEVSQAKQELVQAQNEENFIKEVQSRLQPTQTIPTEQPNYLQSQELFNLAPVEEIQYIQQPEFNSEGIQYAQQGGEIGENDIVIKKSNIQGNGAFINTILPEGSLIGLTHTNNQPSTKLGQYHNHSENPNSESIKIGNQRFLVTTKPVKNGEEITVNYRMQPELEQPEDFKNTQQLIKKKRFSK